MSDAEAGLGGVWSCLYCERTWLPATQARDIALSPLVGGGDEALRCACGAGDLAPVSVAGHRCAHCAGCGGLLLPRGTIHDVAPALIRPITLSGRDVAAGIALVDLFSWLLIFF